MECAHQHAHPRLVQLLVTTPGCPVTICGISKCKAAADDDLADDDPASRTPPGCPVGCCAAGRGFTAALGAALR